MRFVYQDIDIERCREPSEWGLGPLTMALWGAVEPNGRPPSRFALNPTDYKRLWREDPELNPMSGSNGTIPGVSSADVPCGQIRIEWD